MGVNQAVIGTDLKQENIQHVWCLKIILHHHIPRRLRHALRPRKWLNQLHQAAQTATKRIQIMKVSQTFHAASETPQQASTAWGSHSSPFHSHLEHQSPAVTDRYRWQHSRIHHNHYPPLESRLKACLHPLGLYSQTTINKPKHSIIWYTGIEEYREEKLLKKQSKSGRSEDLSSKARFHELSKGWGVREWKQMDFK